MNGAVRTAVAVIEDHQCTLVAVAVGVGEDILIDRAVALEEVVEEEVGALRKEPAAMQQRGNLAFVALDEPVVGGFVVAGALVLHAVLFGEAFDLAVAEHGQSGEGGHHDRHAEAFVALAELVNCRAFIGIRHEVNVTLEDVRIELNSFFDDITVLGVLLVAQHVHEGRVVDAVHAEGADEVALHEPESFGQQQRAGDFGGDAVDHLAPELMRHALVELGLRHGVLGAGGDGAGGAGAGEPEAMEVSLGQSHGRIKTDDGKEARDVEDGLDDLLADGGVQVVELRGVVPRKAGAVVAVVDVAGVAGVLVDAAEDDGGVGLLEVVVVDFDFDAAVGGEIGPVEAVGRVGRVRAGDEPLGMLDNPGRIDAHVVGHHVTGQAHAVVVCAVAQADVGGLAAEVVGNAVVEERVGTGYGIGVSAELLDGFGGAAALPDADEPKRVEPATGERSQLLVGNLVEPVNVAAVLFAELRQPHVGAFGDKHGVGHPGRVGRELFVLMRGIAEDGHLRLTDDGGPLLRSLLAAAARGFFRPVAGLLRGGVELHPNAEFLLAEHFSGDREELVEAGAEQRTPEAANERQLLAERGGRAAGRGAQQVKQADGALLWDGNEGAGGEVLAQVLRDLLVDCALGQVRLVKELAEGLEGLVAVGGP